MVFVKRKQVAEIIRSKKRRINTINLTKERDIILLRSRIGNSLYIRKHLMNKTEPELYIGYKTTTTAPHLILECQKFKKEKT